ncbi:MAG TPA: segregation/condensation protein A [Saprospiraceae bacterium]|jgi:segregation and condensation protein A|nr:segregation/condensation protein A [Saprospiraceae bacterium]MBK8826065.1 segregation/condensation protein A [Saprospiraceae bacterium]MBK9582633.1 segregation/condensation protein A [Saprospiraceae bacterium]HMT53592.1 segregation/condensation protein A [Saprospiraceae bacterium]HMT70752.1 segregation/condensation protein A [Saprospiraceae bacterium]
MDSYTIKTQHFEGPFDLLLFFIERDELDINDIPIAQITNDFLDYIRHLEALDIDVASEFILVAATLMRIKAKMLIPRKEIDEEGNEIDPREELAQKLIEYRKYKSIIDEMSALEENRHFRHSRGNVSAELKEIAEKALVDIELESLNLYKLLQTFQQLMKRYEDDLNKPKHQIVKFEYTIEDQQNYILHQLKREKKVKFQDVFLKLENRIQAIVTFIALLELLNLQTVNLVQGEGVNNFWLAAV